MTPFVISNNLILLGSVATGSTPAQSGTIRLSNSDDIVWRNSGDDGDNIWFSIGGSDQFILGESTSGPFIQVNPELRCIGQLTVTTDDAAAFSVQGAGLDPIIFKVDTTTPSVTFGEGVAAPMELILDSADLVGDGQRDSHAILWTGKGFETATPHDIDWKAFVDVTANDGTGSLWTLQTRIDAGGYANILLVGANVGSVSPSVPPGDGSSHVVTIGNSSFAGELHIIGTAGTAFLKNFGFNLNVGHTSGDVNLLTGGLIRLSVSTAGDTEVLGGNNLFLLQNDLGAPGTSDSGVVRWQGVSDDGSDHDIEWQQFVDVTANDGTGSIFTLQTRIDAASFVTVFTIRDDGFVTLEGNVISDGASTFAEKFRLEGSLTGVSGDTTFLGGAVFSATVTTQAVAEVVADVFQVRIDEPVITLGAGSSITNAQSLLIVAAPTEGVNNYAVRVISGATFLGGELEHAGSTLGFFGTSPAAQPAAYTRTATIVEDRTLLASASATAINNNNVLAALIADLQSLGVIG
jgi:hypothetical protein